MKTLLTALLLILASIVRAEPVAVAVVGEVTITLTDEPCRHTDVIDMHYRVT